MQMYELSEGSDLLAVSGFSFYTYRIVYMSSMNELVSQLENLRSRVRETRGYL